MVALSKRARARRKNSVNGIVIGKQIKVCTDRGLRNFVNQNNGIRAIAYQRGDTFCLLANNGNSSTLFNSDTDYLRDLIKNKSIPLIPIIV